MIGLIRSTLADVILRAALWVTPNEERWSLCVAVSEHYARVLASLPEPVEVGAGDKGDHEPDGP
jgi:hypothetical protein